MYTNQVITKLLMIVIQEASVFLRVRILTQEFDLLRIWTRFTNYLLIKDWKYLENRLSRFLAIFIHTHARMMSQYHFHMAKQQIEGSS